MLVKQFLYLQFLHIWCPQPEHLLTDVDITAAKHSMQAYGVDGPTKQASSVKTTVPGGMNCVANSTKPPSISLDEPIRNRP